MQNDHLPIRRLQNGSLEQGSSKSISESWLVKLIVSLFVSDVLY